MVGNSKVMRLLLLKLSFRTSPDRQKTNNLRCDFVKNNKKGVIVTQCFKRQIKLAERVGFEPTLEFPLNTLSKRAPSATRPSLRRFREATAMQARTCSSRFYVAWASVATGTQIRQEIRALKTMRASSCRLFLDSKNLALLWTGTEVGLWSVLLGLVLQARLVSHPAALDC